MVSKSNTESTCTDQLASELKCYIYAGLIADFILCFMGEVFNYVLEPVWFDRGAGFGFVVFLVLRIALLLFVPLLRRNRVLYCFESVLAFCIIFPFVNFPSMPFVPFVSIPYNWPYALGAVLFFIGIGILLKKQTAPPKVRHLLQRFDSLEVRGTITKIARFLIVLLLVVFTIGLMTILGPMDTANSETFRFCQMILVPLALRLAYALVAQLRKKIPLSPFAVAWFILIVGMAGVSFYCVETFGHMLY